MTAHSDQARRARGRRRAVVAGALACSLAGLGVASASTVTVNGGAVSTAQAGPCATAVTVTRTEPVYFLWWVFGYEGVRVSGSLDGCRGREVVVRGTSGSPAATGSVATTGSTNVDLATARYGTTQAFVVTIDGWQIPATTTNG